MKKEINALYILLLTDNKAPNDDKAPNRLSDTWGIYRLTAK